MKVYDEKGLRSALQNLDAPPRPQSRPHSPCVRRLGLKASVICAGVGSILHAASFFVELDHVSLIIVGLAVASMASFGAMIVASRLGQETRRLARSRGGVGEVMASALAENLAALKKIPPVAIACVVVAGIYFAINFLLLIGNMAEGSPVEKNGDLLLMNHGSMIRPLDRAEFRHLQTLEFRGMSGHFIMFSGIAALGFAYLVDGRENDAS